MIFEKHLKSSFHLRWAAKLSRFFRRSIFRYFFASLLFGIAVPELFGGYFATIFGLFFMLVAVVLTLLYLTVKHFEKKNRFDAIVEFSTDGIKISHTNKDLVEEKKWNWIRFIIETEHEVFFETRQKPILVLSLPKTALSKDEMAFFRDRGMEQLSKMTRPFLSIQQKS